VLNKLFPAEGMGDYDEVDYYGTFTSQEAAKLGVIPIDGQLEGRHESDGTSDPAAVSEAFDKEI
jgi:nucleobase:cation symporter-1, NCS1 family